jgi:hypothetical protein
MQFSPPTSDPTFAAVDVGTIITLAIILISFIGWIFNLVSEKAKQPPRRPEVNANPQHGGRDRFQQEIDKFLQQVGGRPAAAPARPAPKDDFLIEVVPEDELLQRQREERRRKKLSEIEDRHVQTSQLGEGLRSQVDSRMHGSLDQKVRLDVGDRIAAVVEADFGESKTDLVAPVVGPASVKPHEIVQLLRDRDGVRKAIIVNEILKRRPRR